MSNTLAHAALLFFRSIDRRQEKRIYNIVVLMKTNAARRRAHKPLRKDYQIINIYDARPNANTLHLSTTVVEYYYKTQFIFSL